MEEEKIEERGTNQFFSLADENMLENIPESESEKPQVLIQGKKGGDHSDDEDERR